MTTHREHANKLIEQIVSDFKATPDTTERAKAVGAMLDAIPTLQRSLREVRQEAVLELRQHGLSHAQVAQELGVTRSRAQQIAEGRTGSNRRPKDTADGDK